MSTGSLAPPGANSVRRQGGNIAVVLLVIFVSMISLGVWWKTGHQVSRATPVEACTEKGVAYFAAIGSYPTLKSRPDTGKRAEDVARERCTKTTTAFDAL